MSEEMTVTNEESTMTNQNANRLEWVEPSLRKLDVHDTTAGPNHGTDGNTTYADCTKS